MDQAQKRKTTRRPNGQRAKGQRTTSLKHFYEGRFHFDPNDPIYKDHFPGKPVVPGSLIVQAFVKAAESLSGAFKVTKVENFRFKRFVAPGIYPYHLDLCQDGKNGSSFRCRLLDGDQVVVSGVLA